MARLGRRFPVRARITQAAAQPSVTPSAGLATATGTAFPPSVFTQSATDFILNAGEAPVPNRAVDAVGASLATPLSPPSRLLTPPPKVIANAGLATATGTAFPPSVFTQSATGFILIPGEFGPNSTVDPAGASLAPALSPPSRLVTATPVVIASATLAHAAAAAFTPSVLTQSATVLILTAQAPSSPDSALQPAGASLPAPLSAIPLLITRAPIVTANAGLAHATGTAPPPLAAIAAQPALAHATGTAQSPSVFTQSATSFVPTAGAPVPGSLARPAGASLATPLTAPARRITVPPGGAASAGLATATGSSQQPRAAIGAQPALAHATGTAQQSQASVFQPVGYLLAAGQPPVPDLAAGQAGGSLPAPLSPRSRLVAAQPIATPAAGLAHATGTVQQPQAAIGAQPGLSHATGTALQPSAQALQPVTLVLLPGRQSPGMTAPQAGASLPVPLSPPSRRVTAPPAGVVTAGLATATGTAQQPRAALGAGAVLAHATGTAQPAAVFAQSVSDLVLAAGEFSPDSILTAVGASLASPLSPPGRRIAIPAPSAGVSAGLAHAAGTAQTPRAAAGVQAGLGSAAAAAQSPQPSAGARAALAHGTGTGYGPGTGRTPRLATAAGTALTPLLAAAAHAQAAAALAAAIAPGAQGNVPNLKGSSKSSTGEAASAQAVTGENARMSATVTPGASSQGGVT